MGQDNADSEVQYIWSEMDVEHRSFHYQRAYSYHSKLLNVDLQIDKTDLSFSDHGKVGGS